MRCGQQHGCGPYRTWPVIFEEGVWRGFALQEGLHHHCRRAAHRFPESACGSGCLQRCPWRSCRRRCACPAPALQTTCSRSNRLVAAHDVAKAGGQQAAFDMAQGVLLSRAIHACMGSTTRSVCRAISQAAYRRWRAYWMPRPKARSIHALNQLRVNGLASGADLGKQGQRFRTARPFLIHLRRGLTKSRASRRYRH